MNRESPKTSDKCGRSSSSAFPPVPPKPKNYNRDLIKILSTENMTVYNHHHHHHHHQQQQQQQQQQHKQQQQQQQQQQRQQQKKKPKRDPPPVPPKPRGSLRPRSVSPQRRSNPFPVIRTHNPKTKVPCPHVAGECDGRKREAVIIINGGGGGSCCFCCCCCCFSATEHVATLYAGLAIDNNDEDSATADDDNNNNNNKNVNQDRTTTTDDIDITTTANNNNNNSNNVAFTTEDRDIFSNSRAPFAEYRETTEMGIEKAEETESQLADEELKVDQLKDECLEEIAEEEEEEEKEEEEEDGKVKDADPGGTSGDADDRHTDRSRAALTNGAVIPPKRRPSDDPLKSQNYEPPRRIKLTGSVSFTSFDRNSSTKEVNLKKQIFKQLYERNERKESERRKRSHELCLSEGNFSDEEINYEQDNDDNDDDNNISDNDSNSNSPLSSSGPQKVSKTRNDDLDERRHRVAMEMLSTEESYVRRLHLIDQVFHLEILYKNRELNMFPEDHIVQMFSNIKSIFQFHKDFLLVQLKKRLKDWKVTPMIGDIMKKFAPFLKLYTEYVQNFDNAISLIKFWTERSPEFNNLLEKLQRRPECGQMSLQHHMLEPIQRVPRYLVLLKEYIKYLPEDSNDRSDSLAALNLVQEAASHSNESLRTLDQFQKMLSINERLGNLFNAIDPGRRFIKEGTLKRISPRDGSQTDRYLFLFHDILLICQGTLTLSKHQYKIKMKLDTSDMELSLESHSLKTPESFHLFCKEKCLELLAQSKKSREEWINALTSCINLSKLRRSSATSQFSNEELGKRAPIWTKNQETSMCMICRSHFSFFQKKKHCHACGKVVCTKCSNNKMQLPFAANELRRVCHGCFHVLRGPSNVCPRVNRSRKCHPSLEMKAFDNHLMCGYLKLSQDRRIWQELYVTINTDFVLYMFKAHKDVAAHLSLPLPGYSIDKHQTEPKMFTILHRSCPTTRYFLSDNEDAASQWVEVLKTVAGAELPEDFRGCQSQKCPNYFMPL